MDILQLLMYLLSISGITVAIVYLAKLMLNKFFDFGIEKYKSSLAIDAEKFKAEVNQNLEKYRADLKIIELEHQIKYSSLHTQRSEFIYDLYKNLLEVQDALYYLTTPNQGKDWAYNTEKTNAAISKLQEMNRLFQKNKILINKTLCGKIQNVVDVCDEIINEMETAKLFAQDEFYREQVKNAIQKWQTQFDRVRIETTELRSELEDEFRVLLGSV